MLAPANSQYLLENPKNVPTLELYKQCFPLGDEVHNAVPVAGTASDGFSPIYRNQAVKNAKSFVLEGLETNHHLFEDIAKQVPDHPCIKYLPQDYENDKPIPVYEHFTYDQVRQLKNAVASGILHQLQNNPHRNLNLESHRKIDAHTADYRSYTAKNHSFVVTLYSSNRWEWLVSDIACSSYSITNTALYDTLGANTSEYILSQTQSPIVISSKQHIASLIELKKSLPQELENLITIVSMDPLFPEDYRLGELAEQQHIKLLDFNQLIGLGKLFPLEPLAPNKDTMYTISYTSGTTGANPKGVTLTQAASASSISFVLALQTITPDNFCFLPLAHIFERETSLYSLATGATLIMPRLNYTPLTLVEDLILSKPTRISLVPRVLNKFEAVLKNATIDNPELSDFKRGLFRRVFDSKKAAQSVADQSDGKSFIYDKLIINKIRSKLGFDNMQHVIVGSAPIDPETVRFLKSALQVGIAQGYGCTETFAGCALTQSFEANPGTSGAPGINTEFKIKEYPDMNYTLKDKGGPRGELLIRSAQNFVEYYKNPEETAKALDSEGWYHSGDVAQVNELGRVAIIDRVKNFFKLAQGEYIAPESIENKYQSNNPILFQIFVHGDSLKNYLVGILGIDKASQIAFLSKHCKISLSELKTAPDSKLLELINEKTHKKILISLLNSTVPQLKSFQKIKNAAIEFEPLTLDRDVVTPTMKVKRPVAKKFFADTLAQLYEEGPIVDEAKL